MKKSTKVIIASIVMCLIVSVAVFCTLAVKNFALDVGGEIEFVALGIDATISDATLSGVSKKMGRVQCQHFLSRQICQQIKLKT